ncbi:MAG: DsrE family protein [Lactobacillus sp.]|jgi:intracellular sulfur oxidation DsrE/DsrF family protein|nr:DsrE family protein [Lactobacillus sp.]MCI2032934.1 DsrE family protein [Lactobacillus sp.]
MNVIFHIDDSKKWPTLLNNVQHFREWLQAQSDNSTLEVLINGEAVSDAVLDSPIDLSLLARTVNIAVCANSMHQRQLTKAQLQDGVTMVPSGVVELAQRQHHGFAYIKP